MTTETQLFSATHRSTHDINNKCLLLHVHGRRIQQIQTRPQRINVPLFEKQRNNGGEKRNLMFPTGGIFWLQFCSLVSEASPRRETQRKNPARCSRTDEQKDTHLAAASGKKQSAAYWLAAVCDFINRGRPREARRTYNTSFHSIERPQLACLLGPAIKLTICEENQHLKCQKSTFCDLRGN